MSDREVKGKVKGRIRLYLLKDNLFYLETNY